MVSTFAAALLAALGLSGPAATHAAPPSTPTFFISGHGWGHGVGLAQYGAYGYALHGWTSDQIVAHYYPGNDLGLEPYLWGVVPSEMPDTWPAEALKAQAVVARTYALTHMQGGGDFDLYPDTRSQVYGGIDAESLPAHDAVNGTTGQVVLYK